MTKFMTNPIVENACYHNFNPYGEQRLIFVTKEDFKEIYHLIHDDYKPHVRKALREMSKGIDYCFWFEDRRIVFEG